MRSSFFFPNNHPFYLALFVISISKLGAKSKFSESSHLKTNELSFLFLGLFLSIIALVNISFQTGFLPFISLFYLDKLNF